MGRLCYQTTVPKQVKCNRKNAFYQEVNHNVVII